MMKEHTRGYILFILTFIISIDAQFTVLVSQYGAYANDTLDDTAGINAAIQAAASMENPGITTILLDTCGTYYVTGTINLHGVNLTLSGISYECTYIIANLNLVKVNETTYIRAGFSLFDYYGLHLAFRWMNLEFSPPSHIGGVIVGMGTITDTQYSGYIDILPADVYNVTEYQPNSFSLANIMRVDPISHRLADGPLTNDECCTFDPYQWIINPDGKTIRTKVISIGSWNINDSVVVAFTPGPGWGSNMFDSSSNPFGKQYAADAQSRDILFEHIQAWGSPSWIHFTYNTADMTFRDFHSFRKPNLWWSSSSDCIDINMVHGSLWIEDSSCESSEDDSNNVRSTVISGDNFKWMDNNTMIIQGNNVYYFDFIVQDGLSIYHTVDNGSISDMVIYADLAVVQIIQQQTCNNGICTLILRLGTDRFNLVPIDPMDNTYSSQWLPTDNLLGKTLLYSHYKNFTTGWNRARGILLHHDNVLVEECYFKHNSGPGILFEFIGEGGLSKNVT
jgi:hypothetical protein